jgi:glycosyltransferase involved in cell wall biosynthesis
MQQKHDHNNRITDLNLVNDKILELEKQIREKDRRIYFLKNRVDQHAAHVKALCNSKSWKVTHPLRIFMSSFIIQRPKLGLQQIKQKIELIKRQGGLGNIVTKCTVIYKAKGLKGLMAIIANRLSPNHIAYANWVAQNDIIKEEDRIAIKNRIANLKHHPLISIIMPVYEIDEEYLVKAIESVKNQLYTKWELCIADDKSPSSHIKKILDKYSKNDSKIKVVYRSENGHISAASNSALELATGEFIALLDHDDMLTEHALYMAVEAINEQPDLDMIYSDEDRIDEKDVRFGAYFKNDWNPDLIMSQNMFCHFGVYRSSIIKKIGGFREGYEGAQDYDLLLRAWGETNNEKIKHIPFVLYHWRAIIGSTALTIDSKSYALEKSRNAIQDFLDKNYAGAKAIDGDGESVTCGYHRIQWPIPENAPKVSILIPTKDKIDYLKPCLDSIIQATEYTNYEIIIVDNRSEEQETFDYLSKIAQVDNITVLKYDHEFNYSAINNYAAKHATGEILLLLNNDTKIISPNWLTELVGNAIRPDIGAVGAKLLYDNDLVQHNGVIVGTGEHKVAVHAFHMIEENNAAYYAHALLARNVSAVTGACIAIRKEIYDKVGGLNENELKVAYNDIDLCLKVQELGYRNLITPFAKLYHFESVSRGLDFLDSDKMVRLDGEASYMRERWAKVLDNDHYYNPNLELMAGSYRLDPKPRVVKPWKDN